MTVHRTADMLVSGRRGTDLRAACPDRCREIADAEMQRRHQRICRRQRFDVDQPARGLDQQFHRDGRIARCPGLHDPAADPRHIGDSLRLRDDEGVEPADTAEAPDLFLNRWTVDRVQANGDGLAVPVVRRQRDCGRFQCTGLFGRGHRVFEIHEHRVGG